MSMFSLNNKKIYNKKESRNKVIHDLSPKNNSNSSIRLNKLYILSSNSKNFFSYDNNKSTNFYSSKNNTTKNNFIKFSIYNEKGFTLSENERTKTKKNIFDKRRISAFSSYFCCNIFKNREKQNKNKIKLEDDKICILPNYLKIKNFSLKTPVIMNYLKLNKNTNFLFENNIAKIKKLNYNSYFNKHSKQLRRSGSYTPINKYKKIEDIYPTVFNIEGHKNRKLLEELEIESKKKPKKELINKIILKHNNIMKKNMNKERNKVEKENYKANISDMSYKRQLMLSKTKFFKKDLNHLKRKNSFKFHLDLPLYNLFLNLNY